ncbi:MAG: tetratricopeptide repeat protein, partial [Pseudomonadota bacterium]
MADVFREVDDDLKRDQTTQLVRTYGPWVLAAAVALIIGVAVNAYLENQRLTQAQAASDAYIVFSSDVDALTEAAAIQERTDAVMATTTAGYQALARLKAANRLVAVKDEPAALQMLDALTADTSADQMWRDLASVRSAQLQADELSSDQLEA